MSAEVCRYCGEPIRETREGELVEDGWIHTTGRYRCPIPWTSELPSVAEPVPVAPETGDAPTRPAPELEGAGDVPSRIAPETPELKKSEPEFQSEGDSDIPPDTREAAWLVWAGGSPNRYGSVLRDGFLAGWDAAVKATAASVWDEGFDAGERDAMDHEHSGDWDGGCIQNPYRAEYENGDPT